MLQHRPAADHPRPCHRGSNGNVCHLIQDRYVRSAQLPGKAEPGEARHLSAGGSAAHEPTTPPPLNFYNELTSVAYRYADAMLAARQK